MIKERNLYDANKNEGQKRREGISDEREFRKEDNQTKINFKLFLPKSTEEQVKSYSRLETTNWHIENPSLFYQKFMPLTQENSKDFKSDCLNYFKKSVSNNKELNDIVFESNERIKKLVADYGNRKYRYLMIKAITVSRIVVGLGGASVLESSMTLHKHGFPYIPASAIKGIFEHYLSKEHPDFKKIFGSMDNKGDVIFLDAFPWRYPQLDVDVMTPHFGDYYTKGEPPADYLRPNPIPFITVAKGEKFIFYILSKDNDLLNKIKNEKWLEKTLSNGIGAKTAVGYGEMKIEEMIMS